MSNFIVTITYNVIEENAQEGKRSVRLVNPNSQVLGATIAQVVSTPNWHGQVFVQRDIVNAVFPAPSQTISEESTKTPEEKPKAKKETKKKTTTKKVTSKTKVNGAAKKKPGRPKAKAA